MEVDLVTLEGGRVFLEHDAANIANRAPQRALSPRQRQVLVLLGDGLPARAIASELHLAESTVRNHIRSVLVKLGCHSQLEAVAAGRRRGLL